MDDESQLQAELLPCSCGGKPGLEHFLINAGPLNMERRWRVRCPGCEARTLHYFAPALAVSEWGDRRAEGR